MNSPTKPTSPRLAIRFSCSLALAPPIVTVAPDNEPSASSTSTTTSNAKPETVPAPPPPSDVVADEPAAADTNACTKNGRDTCKVELVGGAVMTALGIAAVGVGAGLTAIPNQSLDDDPSFYRTYHPAGITLIGAGAVMLTYGVESFGAVVFVRADPGLSTEWLERLSTCHMAFAVRSGKSDPELSWSPLAVPRVEASISPAEGSFAIEIRAATSEGAQVVLDRATTLAQRPRAIELAPNEGAGTTDQCGLDSIDAAR